MVTKPSSNRSMPGHDEKMSNPEGLAEPATTARSTIGEAIIDRINRRISLDKEWRKKRDETDSHSETVLKSLQGGSERRTALLEEISRKLDRLDDIDRKFDRLNDVSAKLQALDTSLDRLDSGLKRVANDGVDRVSRPAEIQTAPTMTSHPRTDPPVEGASAGKPTKIDVKYAPETVQQAPSVPSSCSPQTGDKEACTRWPKLTHAFNKRRSRENENSVRWHKHEGKLLPLYDVAAWDPTQLQNFPPTARAFLELDHENVSRLLKSLRPDYETRPEWGQTDWMHAMLAMQVGDSPLHDLWVGHKLDKMVSSPTAACDSDEAQKDQASGGYPSFFDASDEITFSDLALWTLFIFLVGCAFAKLEQAAEARMR